MFGEYTLGTIDARKHVWILFRWERSITLTIAKGGVHITTVLTKRLVWGTTSHIPVNATIIIAIEAIEKV